VIEIKGFSTRISVYLYGFVIFQQKYTKFAGLELIEKE
jgi:hypothetical protein